MKNQLKLSEILLDFIKMEKMLANKHQKMICDATKVSFCTVWRWIKGETKPSARDEESICEVSKKQMKNDLEAMSVVIDMLLDKINKENAEKLD